MAKKRPDKKKCQFLHAEKRMEERTGLEGKDEQFLRFIANRIASGKVKFPDMELVRLYQQTLRLIHWDVVMPEETIHVVYDKKRHSIVTILPRKGAAA